MRWKAELSQIVKAQQDVSASRLRFDEPLDKHLYFGIGGLAAAYFEVATAEELAAVVSLKKRCNLQVATIGRGSNLLVSDDGYEGIVLRLVGQFDCLDFDEERVWAGGGVSLPRLSKASARHGLGGVEFALGIPGSVGGALIMNAGAWGCSFGDLVDCVQVMGHDGRISELSQNDAQFAYRNSRLSEHFCVTGVRLRLASGDVDAITDRMDELYRQKIVTQPFAEENAGCMFKNPTNDSAGRLIELCGLKGHRIGGAEVSTIHGNFILNTGHATAKDVSSLVQHIQQCVKKGTGVQLEMEVKMLGF